MQKTNFVGLLKPTITNLFTYSPIHLLTRRKAFTMAEILLSLTIIGVVAAITLPSLMANINERTWNTQRKALYARMSQAIAMMPQVGGYGTLTEDENGSVTADTAAETFLTDGLSKVLKINNICDFDHLTDCGIPSSYTDMLGSQKKLPATLHELHPAFSYTTVDTGSFVSVINTKTAAFETQNGESLVAYYNPTCKFDYVNESTLLSTGNIVGFPQSTMCVNFLYDLNGNKGPNTIGKDIGVITAFNSHESTVVAPMPSTSQNAGAGTGTYSWADAPSACTNENADSRIPNIDELSAMAVNVAFFRLSSSTDSQLWSGTKRTVESAWDVSIGNNSFIRLSRLKTHLLQVRCVKR